jgi:hypothetical protein
MAELILLAGEGHCKHNLAGVGFHADLRCIYPPGPKGRQDCAPATEAVQAEALTWRWTSLRRSGRATRAHRPNCQPGGGLQAAAVANHGARIV